MKATKNVVFDMGGVLINIDYDLTINAFKKLGYPNFSQMYAQYEADETFSLLETGKISESDFYKRIIQKGPQNTTIESIKKAWNAMLLDFRISSISFLHQLRSKKNLYLLSNTNVIHLEDVRSIYAATISKQPMDELFLKSWYSNEIGYRKPDKECFQYILEDASIDAEETLFIDDSYNNIETAVALGIKTHLLVPGERIEDLVYD